MNGEHTKTPALPSEDHDVWWPIDTAPENKVVNTKIDDMGGARNHQKLKRQGRLWWFEDGSMYVYYRPTHWQEIPSEPS